MNSVSAHNVTTLQLSPSNQSHPMSLTPLSYSLSPSQINSASNFCVIDNDSFRLDSYDRNQVFKKPNRSSFQKVYHMK